MSYVYGFYFLSFVTSLVKPFWGFVGLIISVLIRFQDRFPEIATIKPFTLLLFGVLIGCAIHREELVSRSWKQDKLMVAMLLISMFGLVLLSPGSLIGETWQFISSIAFYFLASRLMSEKKHFYIMFTAMSCCIAYLGYEAIVSVNQFPETTPYIDFSTGRWQGIGYYANSNEFGQLMVTTMPFLFALLLIRKNIILSIMAIVFIALMVYVIGKAQSRTVMVILGLMFVLTIVLRGKGNVIKKGFIAGIAGGILIIGISFVPGPLQERLNTVLNAQEDESFEGRTRAWGHGFDMLSWYPITGVGKGQWGEYHGLAPHNSFVQVMAETGIPGIIVFLWIISLCFKELMPNINQIEEKSTEEDDFDVWGSEKEISTEPIDAAYDVDKNMESSWDSENYTNGTEVEGSTTQLDNESRTLSIAVLVIFVGWLIYIFVGNQGYSVWTYFYFGVCTAVRHFRYEAEEKNEH